MNKDLFNNDIVSKTNLSDRFIIPPFSIFNSSSKAWQDRKKIWNIRINDKGQARVNKLRLSTNSEIGMKQSIDFMAIKGNTTSVLDPVMSEVLIEWFTEDNHSVFDPFSGDAVFGFVSAYKNRLFEGVELRQEQVDFNQQLIEELNTNSKYICDDAINIKKHFTNNSKDFMFTCPPYADLEVYSDLENDLSNMSYEDFFKTMKNVLFDCFDILKDNRFACIVIGEVRHHKYGYYIGLVPKIIQIMIDAGFHYYNEMILQTPVGNLMMRAGLYMNTNRKIGKQHQNILVFYKGDVSKIKNNFKKIN